MQQNTQTTTAKQLLDTQLNAEETRKENSGKPLITYEGIEGTPFTLVNRENEWFIVMGDYRLTEPTDTKERTLEKLESEKWLIIFHVAATIIEKMSLMKIKELKERHNDIGDNMTENT